jgi:hypothetical protein
MKKLLRRPVVSIPAAGRRSLHASREISSMAEPLFQQEGRTGPVCQPMSRSGTELPLRDVTLMVSIGGQSGPLANDQRL